MFGRDDFRLRFHWHYTSAGCSVSPHCDARRKIGSHIFYLNTENDWRPEWGGETLILDGVGRIPMNSAPRFEDFADAKPAATLGNRSLLLMRRPHSWHGVKRLACPPHALRKVFIVVVEDWSLPARLRALVRTRNRGGY
jgi:Rps23 Pro-64 3,4-dihydroxylase Tpa1-like proline 4-hydroxylase